METPFMKKYGVRSDAEYRLQAGGQRKTYMADKYGAAGHHIDDEVGGS